MAKDALLLTVFMRAVNRVLPFIYFVREGN